MHNRRFSTAVWKSFVVAIATVIAAGAARGHVILDLPNGGEELTPADTYTIIWHKDVAHPMGNWDLSYSTTGAAGPWTEIELDLYEGDTTPINVDITYDWTVPDAPTDLGRVRIVMDGTTGTWEDISNSDFTIVPEPATITMLTFAGAALILRRRQRRCVE